MQPFTGGASVKELGEGENMGSNFVRKQAAQNLLKMVGGTAAILMIAKALDPDSVDFDPRSANFGKIKVRNTRFDVTGGMGSIITLAARLITHSTKSSITGKVKPLNEKDASGKPKFGATTMDEVFVDFLSNKASPAARVALDYGKGQTFEGEPPTLGQTARDLVTPLPHQERDRELQRPECRPDACHSYSGRITYRRELLRRE